MSTISRPNGVSDTGISLKFASPSGIPMIVTHIKMPPSRCPIASHHPARMIQITLPTIDPAPAPGLRTSVRPNGHRQNSAIRPEAIPNGIVMIFLIVTIPFGIASARIALFCLWPFGRTIVRRPDAGTGSLIGNVIWFILAGWWLAIGHIITGVLMCITIIGIPLGLANFKLIPVSLTPFGREIVDLEQARRLGYDAYVSVPAGRAPTE